MRRSGLTLLEILLVMALIAMLAGTGFLAVGSIRAKQALAVSAEEMAAAFKRAHIYSREGKDDKAWGLKYRDNRSYMLVSGERQDFRAEAEYTVTLPAAITSGPFEVWFDPGTGGSAADVAVKLGTPRGNTEEVRVSSSGVVEIR